jgi:hypothetical protein
MSLHRVIRSIFATKSIHCQTSVLFCAYTVVLCIRFLYARYISRFNTGLGYTGFGLFAQNGRSEWREFSNGSCSYKLMGNFHRKLPSFDFGDYLFYNLL